MKHKLTLVLLSFFLGVQCMVAQQMKVTGVVINEDDGEPVIGASIVVKGTTIGTITDLDGKFELETQKDAKLIMRPTQTGGSLPVSGMYCPRSAVHHVHVLLLQIFQYPERSVQGLRWSHQIPLLYSPEMLH